MAKQLLIYERAAPITARRHRDWSVAPTRDFSFVREVNSLPLVASEFLSAAQEYAIVFAGEGEAIMPSAIFGIGQENAFVAADGRWTGRYVPAFLRRYPFVFSRSEDGSTFTLCIDEDYPGLNEEGRGERLFDSQGERTQYLETMLAFTREYQAQFERTRLFCAKLRDLGLLEPAQAQFRLPGGRSASLAGFLTINRQKLKELGDSVLGEMVRSDELELCYAHLGSLANVTSMAEKLAAAQPTAAAAEAPIVEPVEG